MTAAEPKSVDPEQTALGVEYKHNRPLTSCHWDPKSRFVFFGAEAVFHQFRTFAGKLSRGNALQQVFFHTAARDRAYLSSVTGDRDDRTHRSWR